MQTWHYWALTAVLLPLLAGGAVVIWHGVPLQSRVDGARQWVESTHARLATSPSFWRRHILRWLLWPWSRLEGLTQTIEQPAWRAGAMATGYAYGLVLALALAAALLYATVIVAIFLLMLAATLWILGKVLGGDSSDDEIRPQRHASTSRERTDWLGDRQVEHLDEDGRVLARSQERKDILGNAYTEHRDAEGRVIGTSERRKDLLGDQYVAHLGADGDMQGTSRDRTDILGDHYVEHQDADGHRVGESRTARDLFGDRVVKHQRDSDR